MKYLILATTLGVVIALLIKNVLLFSIFFLVLGLLLTGALINAHRYGVRG